MILGEVTGLQAWVDVVLRLGDGSEHAVKCVVDTGFHGELALPPVTATLLGLSPKGQWWAKLADDSYASVPIFAADILWDDQEVRVTVMAMGSRPLVGTELLQGFNLSVDFEEDGQLSLTAL